MLWTDTMMNATQPGFKVGEYEMNDGHEFFGHLRIAPFCDGHVVIAMPGQPGVTVPVIGDDFGARNHDAFHETAQRIGASVGNQGKPDTTGVPPGLPLVKTAVALALANFDGTSHNDHAVNAAPLAARAATHIGFIGLDDFFGLAADPIRSWSERTMSALSL